MNNKSNPSLPNEIAGYVQTLKRDNERLKAENLRLVEHCNSEIAKNKSTYGNEISTLRASMEELQKAKATAQFHNQRLLEENKNLRTKMDPISMKLNDLETTNATLRGEVAFLNNINANSSAMPKFFNQDREKLEVEISSVREEMSEKFDHYKEKLQETFNKQLKELSDKNEILNNRITQILSERRSLQEELSALHSRQSKHADNLARVCSEHEKATKENYELQSKLQQLQARIIELEQEKICSEKDNYVIRSMLKRESNVLNASGENSVTSKRRKVDEGKGSVRIQCDISGHNVLIVNNGPGPINLNEWTLDLQDMGSGESLMSYTFARREVGARRMLRVWSKSWAKPDDEDNLAMIVDLPDVTGCTHGLSCGLSNDMDELEAVCEIQAPLSQRHILKVARRA